MVTPPKDFRPFNYAHAQDGAPVGTASGLKFRALEWTRKTTSDFPIVGLVTLENGNEQAVTCTDGGGVSTGGGPLVMLPLGYVEGKPVFVGDELQWKNGADRHTVNPEDNIVWKDWRWPAAPVVYPVSSVTPEEAFKIYYGGILKDKKACMGTVINLVVKRLIDEGQVVPVVK